MIKIDSVPYQSPIENWNNDLKHHLLVFLLYNICLEMVKSSPLSLFILEFYVEKKCLPSEGHLLYNPFVRITWPSGPIHLAAIWSWVNCTLSLVKIDTVRFLSSLSLVHYGDSFLKIQILEDFFTAEWMGPRTSTRVFRVAQRFSESSKVRYERRSWPQEGRRYQAFGRLASSI